MPRAGASSARVSPAASRCATLPSRTPSRTVLIAPTARDRCILIALERCPLTVAQLLKASVTFGLPFTTIRRVQERMALLTLRGLTQRYQYAEPGKGTMNYYGLSPEGYRVLRGHDAMLPGHRFFEPLSNSRLPHTLALADFIVHAVVAAQQGGFEVQDFHREGSLRLTVGSDFLYPDSTFRLEGPDGRTFDFFVELDNGTETVRTCEGNGAFERKVRFYEAYKDYCKAEGFDHRFRVLLATTGTTTRVRHLLARTGELLRLKHRPLVYGLTLEDFLACAAPLTETCFQDHRQTPRALVPPVNGLSARSLLPFSQETWPMKISHTILSPRSCKAVRGTRPWRNGHEGTPSHLEAAVSH